MFTSLWLMGMGVMAVWLAIAVIKDKDVVKTWDEQEKLIMSVIMIFLVVFSWLGALFMLVYTGLLAIEEVD